jgi:hypothetical protein
MHMKNRIKLRNGDLISNRTFGNRFEDVLLGVPSRCNEAGGAKPYVRLTQKQTQSRSSKRSYFRISQTANTSFLQISQVDCSNAQSFQLHNLISQKLERSANLSVLAFMNRDKVSPTFFSTILDNGSLNVCPMPDRQWRLQFLPVGFGQRLVDLHLIRLGNLRQRFRCALTEACIIRKKDQT